MKSDSPREGEQDALVGQTQISGRTDASGPEAQRGATPAQVPERTPPPEAIATQVGATQWSAGQRIDGRFEIRAIAGMGGMGIVYRAVDLETGRDVALKLLRPGAEQERFAREAHLLSELEHENIVRYVAHGNAQGMQLYLAMEWLEGIDLGTRLRSERLSVLDAVSIAKQVAGALAVAHDAGVIHRDINPRNIFLIGARADRVRVLDFGVARPPAATVPLTGAGSPIGTPGYMAPEQAQGVRHITAAVDVFGLGCVLYECLTGRRAFSGQTLMELFARILVDDVTPLSSLVSVPQELEALVNSMLRKSAEARPKDGRAVALALEAIGPVSDEPVSELVPPRSESAITDAEQRLSSIILLSPISDAAYDSVVRAALPFGVEPQRTADGAAVMVVGNRGSATDQVAAAARCALAVSAVVSEASIAVATGRAVTNGDKPSGEAIERASAALLVVLAGDGTRDNPARSRISVDQVTASLLDGRFDVVKAESVLLLKGMRDVGEPIRTVLGRRTRCVGRRRELGFLHSTLEECVEDGVARAVLVTGPSGIGKTRLGHEFLREVRREQPDAAVLLARCEPTEAGSPFAVLARAIRGYTGISEHATNDVQQWALYEWLSRSVEPSELERVHQFLCELCGAPLPDDASPQLRAARGDYLLSGDQMLRAFEDWLSAECRRHPVLLVLDDLHWGDLPSVRFIDAALRNLSEEPLMVLALAQPEVLKSFPELWARRGLFQLRLTGLSRRASERLVHEVLGDAVEPSLVQRVIERAQGNPFWIEELLRAEHESERAPEAIVLMAQARLERLSSDARLVLRAASILGRRFWDAGVLALLGPKLSSVALSQLLMNLEEREVVAARESSRFPSQREYEFSSSLLREAAYASLTAGDRQRGHLAAGAWLESVGEQDAVALAEHYSQGGAAERATEWYRLAARQALSGNDWARARERARLGRAAGAVGELAARLWVIEAEACKWSGDNATALECSLEALGQVRPGSGLWCRAAGEAVSTAGKLSRPDVYRHWSTELLAAPADGDNKAALIIALSRGATQLVLCGELEIAGALLERALELSADFDAPLSVPGWLLEARAVHAGAVDRASDRVKLAAAAAEQFREAGDLRNACLQQISVGFACVEVGAYVRARAALTEALEVAQRMGLSNSVPIAQAQLGRALGQLGERERGRELLHSAIEALDQHGNARLAGIVRSYLALLLLNQGALPQAEEAAAQSVQILEAAPAMRPMALAALSLIRAAQGNASESLALAHEANAAVGPETRLNFGEALVRLSLISALMDQGRREEATILLQHASERLACRAGLISDPELKESFLTAVTENARTLELASKVVS